ncbi:hypothetical protein DV515_00002494 [Chloebia gouldiae]|uniref:Uncharacterized protein n=1 Tax=Chloebia gouldiae TaxID=44316 RepID=A0A3L8SWL1_CHLGU|nr:hypothetical protein DV515_00002494 [Chloebia gouldiae]
MGTELCLALGLSLCPWQNSFCKATARALWKYGFYRNRALSNPSANRHATLHQAVFLRDSEKILRDSEKIQTELCCFLTPLAAASEKDALWLFQKHCADQLLPNKIFFQLSADVVSSAFIIKDPLWTLAPTGQEKAKGSAGVTPLTPMAFVGFNLQNRRKKRKPFLHLSPLQFLKVISVQCCRKDYTS